MATIFSLGHGAASPGELLGLLRDAGVVTVVDVRRYPASRRHPHAGRDAMSAWLGEAGVGYAWAEALGGRRDPLPSSPHTALRDPQMRGYADHMATAAFRDAAAALAARAGREPVAVLCAESSWPHCHRAMLADYLTLVLGMTVEHLSHDGRRERHAPAPQVRCVDGARLVYDCNVALSLFDP